MQKLIDGTLVGLTPVKPPTHPKNIASDDSLMMAEVLNAEQVDLLVKCLDNYIE